MCSFNVSVEVLNACSFLIWLVVREARLGTCRVGWYEKVGPKKTMVISSGVMIKAPINGSIFFLVISGDYFTPYKWKEWVGPYLYTGFWDHFVEAANF